MEAMRSLETSCWRKKCASKISTINESLETEGRESMERELQDTQCVQDYREQDKQKKSYYMVAKECLRNRIPTSCIFYCLTIKVAVDMKIPISMETTLVL